MRIRTWLTLAGVVFLGVSASVAGELVYFSNGTFLKIDSHEVKGEMVQVQLDQSSKLAFPARMIDRIEGDGGVVWGNGAASTVAKNQALPGVSLPQSPAMQGLRGVNPGSKKSWEPEPGSGIQATQKKPQVGFGMSGSAGEKQYLDGVVLGATRQGSDGSKMIGNRVIVNPDIVTSRGRTPVRFQASAGPQNVIPSPQPPAQSNPGDVVTAPSHPQTQDEPPVVPDDPGPEPTDEGAGDGADPGDGSEGN